MMTALDDAASPPPGDSEALLGLPAFRDAVLALVEALPASAVREMVWLDRDFADWPLGSLALTEALGAWLKAPGRRLTLVALEVDVLPRVHPRFMAWRRPRAHVMPGRQLCEVEPSRLPTLIWCGDGPWIRLARADPVRGRRGAAGREGAQMREQIDVFLQRSVDAFSPDVLGL